MDQPYLAWTDRAAVDTRVASVDEAELGYDDCEARYLFHDQPFTGFSAKRYPDGTLWCITGYADGIEHGAAVAWYPDGRIQIYAEMGESVYHGIVAKWDASGALIGITRYNLGLEVKSDPSRKRCQDPIPARVLGPDTFLTLFSFLLLGG